MAISLSVNTMSYSQAAQMAAIQQQMMQELQQRRYMQQCGGGQRTDYNWNLPNATVGQHGFLGLQDTKGFGLDLNGSGRYEAGRDGVLAFDFNRDGRVTPDEIERSRQSLNAAGGNYDLNGDGRVSPCERMQGRSIGQDFRNRVDQNGDGRFSSWELAAAGGRVLVDGNQDGKFQPWEQHSVYNFPTPGFGRGRLNGVDPFFGSNSVTTTQPWFGNPWGPRPY